MKKEEKNNRDLQFWQSEIQDPDYYERQYSETYESTKGIFDFIDRHTNIENSANVLDACCGNGANAIYAKERYRLRKITGFDFNNQTIESGRKYLRNKNIRGVELYRDDLFSLSDKIKCDIYDGIVMHQTLSWLNNPEKAIEKVGQLKTKWFAMSSLFYDGLLEARSKIHYYDDNGKLRGDSSYNVYSMQIIEKLLKLNGFKKVVYQKFTIRKKLYNDDKDKMGTRTMEMRNGENLQVSGPILMPWMFCIALR